jgi:hypothetical protein
MNSKCWRFGVADFLADSVYRSTIALKYGVLELTVSGRDKMRNTSDKRCTLGQDN